MKNKLLSFVTIITILVVATSCKSTPTSGAYADASYIVEIGKVYDGDFMTGYELTANNELYLPVDNQKEIKGIEISWAVPMDIAIVCSVDAMQQNGEFVLVEDIYPSNTFREYTRYEIKPLYTSCIRLSMSEGVARVMEFKIIY